MVNLEHQSRSPDLSFKNVPYDNLGLPAMAIPHFVLFFHLLGRVAPGEEQTHRRVVKELRFSPADATNPAMSFCSNSTSVKFGPRTGGNVKVPFNLF